MNNEAMERGKGAGFQNNTIQRIRRVVGMDEAFGVEGIMDRMDGMDGVDGVDGALKRGVCGTFFGWFGHKVIGSIDRGLGSRSISSGAPGGRALPTAAVTNFGWIHPSDGASSPTIRPGKRRGGGDEHGHITDEHGQGDTDGRRGFGWIPKRRAPTSESGQASRPTIGGSRGGSRKRGLADLGHDLCEEAALFEEAGDYAAECLQCLLLVGSELTRDVINDAQRPETIAFF